MAVRNNARSGSSQASASCTPIGPPITTSPAMSRTAVGGGTGSFRSIRHDDQLGAGLADGGRDRPRALERDVLDQHPGLAGGHRALRECG